MKLIDFIFFDAGGGHRAAASALRSVMEPRSEDWKIRMVNLQELLDPLDIFRKVTSLRLEDIYNLMLRKGWTLGSPQLTRGMHLVIRAYHSAQVRLLKKHWAATKPDMVVSFVPNFNRALVQSLKGVLPAVPFVTILTDLADYPPHFWMEPESEYLVCGSERAVEQARGLGIPSDRIFRVSGMVLNPQFYEDSLVDAVQERQRLGLRPDVPTGLVLFGGHGSKVMIEIAGRLDRSALNLQLILICGHNEKLRQKLQAETYRIPVVVEGFTKRIPYYMRLADFFVGKPGPGSISEALAMHLPVIVERNAWTLPQERYNAEWVLEREVGTVVRSFRQIEGAVAQLLEPANYQHFRANAAAQNNRAVFEIPEVLQHILARRIVG